MMVIQMAPTLGAKTPETTVLELAVVTVGNLEAVANMLGAVTAATKTLLNTRQ